MATRTKVLQENNIKPLSPLTGEQFVEVFKEATKVALHFEKLSNKAHSHALTSSNSPVSSSVLKLSSSSESPCWPTGKLSSDSPKKKSCSHFELDFKENIHPLLTEDKQFCANECGQIVLADKSGKSSPANFENNKVLSSAGGENNNIIENKIDQNEHIETSDQNEPTVLGKIISDEESKQVYGKTVIGRETAGMKAAETKDTKCKKNPLEKAQKSNLPRLGLRNSRLPKSVNTEKSRSAFSSVSTRMPISRRVVRASTKNPNYPSSPARTALMYVLTLAIQDNKL